MQHTEREKVKNIINDDAAAALGFHRSEAFVFFKFTTYISFHGVIARIC